MTKFKVGDWVRYYNRKEPFKITKIHNDTKGMNAKWKYVADQYTYTKDMLKHWQPQEGEWCWFWDNTDNLQLRKFWEMDKINPHLFQPYGSVMGFKYCEPFLGTLPSCVKD